MPKTRSKKPSRTAKPRSAKSTASAAGTAGAKTAQSRSGRSAAKAKTRKKAGTMIARTGANAGAKKHAAKTAQASQQAVNGSAAHAQTASRARRADGGAEAPRAGKRRQPPRRSAADVVQAALEDMKAQEVSCLDVRHLTSVTDTMFIASGRSDRHVRAVADNVIARVKEAGYAPIGIEGQEAGEWVLVDLADVVVHVMLPRVRDFYKLESLWDLNVREAAAEQ